MALSALGELIDRRRAELGGMSVEALAGRAGVSASSVLYVRQGAHASKPAMRERVHAGIEAALGWEPGSIGRYLAGGPEPRPLADDDDGEAEHVALFRQLRPDDRAALTHIARAMLPRPRGK